MKAGTGDSHRDAATVTHAAVRDAAARRGARRARRRSSQSSSSVHPPFPSWRREHARAAAAGQARRGDRQCRRGPLCQKTAAAAAASAARLTSATILSHEGRGRITRVSARGGLLIRVVRACHAHPGGRSAAKGSVIASVCSRKRNTSAGRPPDRPGARRPPVGRSTPRRSSTRFRFVADTACPSAAM